MCSLIVCSISLYCYVRIKRVYYYYYLLFRNISGVDMATTLLRDVISYSTNRGRAVYTCSLDAEGAFDASPHVISFNRASDVLPDHCWKIM